MKTLTSRLGSVISSTCSRKVNAKMKREGRREEEREREREREKERELKGERKKGGRFERRGEGGLRVISVTTYFFPVSIKKIATLKPLLQVFSFGFFFVAEVHCDDPGILLSSLLRDAKIRFQWRTWIKNRNTN